MAGWLGGASPADDLAGLGAIAGDRVVPLADAAWGRLAAAASPLARHDPALVEAAARPHTAALVYNNAATLNCQRALLAVARALARAAAGGPDDAAAAAAALAAANAAHALRAVLKDLIEQLNADQLRAFVEFPAATATAETHADLRPAAAAGGAGAPAAALAAGALKALGVPGAAAPFYLLRLEAALLLLVLASSQLYAARAALEPGAHPLLEAVIAQADCAPAAVAALLRALIEGAPTPKGLKLFAPPPPPPRSVLRAVGSAAGSVLWLPVTALSLLARRRSAGAADAGAPLADAALLLLLALRFHPAAGNPFRAALAALPDADDAGDAGAAESGRAAAAAAAAAAVPYGALFEALGRALGAEGRAEAPTLLLYALLTGTPAFHEYVLARADADVLLLPLLRALHAAPSASPNALYMQLIVLLVLSQDAAFAAGLHRLRLGAGGAAFYRERALRGTTLGSLAVVLLLRVAQLNLAQLRDAYLHTNTLAVLANLAPHMSGLSAHACQRLVSLFQLLARRRARLAAAEAAAAAAAGAPGAVIDAAEAAAAGERRALELQLYSDFLRIVLEIVNAVLANALPQNPELVYALLHRAEVFAPFAADPRYAELMANVGVVTEFFGRRVDEALGGDVARSPERVLAAIARGARGWRRDRLRPVPELRFSYEEEAAPEEFFSPYVWSLAVRDVGAVPWNLAAIVLFTPAGAPAAGGGEGGGDADGAEELPPAAPQSSV
jgi:hypothetical protein